ncbi:MAG: cytochrome c [Spirochaetia bacterium]|nr:cytochrome c [Spirochaetia bacterium]
MKKIIILILIANVVSCNSIRRKFHYFMDMAYSPALDSQKFDAIGNRPGNRFPPDYTIAHKFLNAKFNRTIPGAYVLDEQDITYNINGFTITSNPDEQEIGSHMISSPLKSDEATLERGKQRFNIYCSPCHGYGGKGDGLVKAKFDNIKAIARPNKTEPVRTETWSVERIFLVTTTGINVMKSYATQVPEIDRWAIAHYVKYLQIEAMK